MAIHPTVKILLDEIDAFRSRYGMSVTAFGQKSLNDPGFIAGLRRRGRVPKLSTVDDVRAFMRTYKVIK
jgi:hypothetical protein